MSLRDERGSVGEWVFFLVAFLFVLVISGCLLYEAIAINWPIAIAKRNYMIAHPELLAVNEWQRGGELPEVNVNLKNSVESK